VVAIGLFLERGRITRFIGEYRKGKPSTAKPEGEKAPVMEKEEEDL
jgi:hypothetical protein